jgi:hypothetical protein
MESRFISDETEGHFANAEHPSDFSDAEITRCIMEIEQTYQLWMLNTTYKTKVLAYAFNSKYFPDIDFNADFNELNGHTSTNLVLIETIIQGRTTPINITGMVNIVGKIYIYPKCMNDLRILNQMLNQTIFYSVYFSEMPEFVVGFPSSISIKVASVFSHSINHNLQGRIQFNDDTYSEWAAGLFVGGLITIDFSHEITIDDVPKIRLTIEELGLYRININIEINCSINTRLDLTYVNTPLIVEDSNENISLSFGFSRYNSVNNLPLDPEISVLVIDLSNTILPVTPTYSSYIWNNVNWEIITISNLTVDCKIFLNFTDSLFTAVAQIINNYHTIALIHDSDAHLYSITIEIDFQNSNTNPDPDPDPDPDPNPDPDSNPNSDLNDTFEKYQLYIITGGMIALGTIVSISFAKKQHKSNVKSIESRDEL